MNKLILVCCGLISSTFGDQDALKYIVNAQTSKMASYNELAHKAAALDYKSNISCLYNGNTGSAFAVSYETGHAVYIPGGSNQTWNSSRQSYEDYFSNWPSLKQFFELGKEIGVTVNTASITGEISENMAEILTSLSEEYSSACVALPTFVHVSKISSDALKSSLDGFVDVVGSFDAEIRGDFKFLIEIFQGMAALFNDVKCGISLLNELGVSLNFGKILKEPTGIHVLIHFLKEIPPTLNVRKHFGNILNKEEKFFSTVDQLGGGLSYGFDGLVHVLSEIVQFLKGQSSTTNIFTILNEFYNNPKTDIKIVREKWPAVVKDLQEAIKDRCLTDDLDGLTNLLTCIQDGKWTVNDVNMSKVINALLEIDTDDDIDAITGVMTLLDTHQT